MVAQSVTGTFTATANGNQIKLAKGLANLAIWGTFVGTVLLERSFDGGTTWIPCTSLSSSVSWTGPATEVLNEPEEGVYYRFRCSAYTSGTINYRISQ